MRKGARPERGTVMIILPGNDFMLNYLILSLNKTLGLGVMGTAAKRLDAKFT
jgi:hypothetical protein